MKYLSTRGDTPPTDLSRAIATGLAPDGGLFVPESVPHIATSEFDSADGLAQTAGQLLAPFFAGDALAAQLPDIAAAALNFDAPLRALGTPNDYLLELFHGPTAAFKDFGARFLAATMQRLPRESDRPTTILVATSGDTGAAVAAAFHRLPGFRVVILYPDGRVSPRQAHQLGCFGDNVVALKVDGTFDDCQQLVKQALGDTGLQAHVPLSSANSISLGRLLPQMSYYAQVALAHHRRHGRSLNFVVPTGNLGNALACILARAVGIPIGDIVLATNANPTLTEFFAGDEYRTRAGIATLANAMDIGAPSNFERLRWLYPDDVKLRRAFTAIRVDDDTIRETIARRYRQYGEILCPHTACAVNALERMRSDGAEGDWAAVATAHPAKFDSVVEPLISTRVPVPTALAELLNRPARAEKISVDYGTLRARLLA